MKLIFSIIKIFFKIIFFPFTVLLWIMQPTKKQMKENTKRIRNAKRRSNFRSVSTSRTPAQRAADWKKFGERKRK